MGIFELETASRLRTQVGGVGCFGAALRSGKDNHRGNCEQDRRRL